MWIFQTSETTEPPVRFRIRSGSVKTVGRAPRADIVVDAGLVSRLHCRLEAGPDRIDVIDLSSTNGTFVNGRRIDRGQLAHGDRLRVGRLELQVERLPVGTAETVTLSEAEGTDSSGAPGQSS